MTEFGRHEKGTQIKVERADIFTNFTLAPRKVYLQPDSPFLLDITYAYRTEYIVQIKLNVVFDEMWHFSFNKNYQLAS